MKINTPHQANMTEMSMMSRFFRFFMKIGLIPLTLNITTNELKFRIWSRPAAYFILYLSIVVGFGNGFCLFYKWGFKNMCTFWTNMYDVNFTDFLTFAVLVFFYAFSSVPFKWFYDITKISNELVLNKDLRWPSHGTSLVCMTFLSMMVQIILAVITIKANVGVGEITIIWISVGLGILFLLSYLTFLNLYLFFLSWLEKYCYICKRIMYKNAIKHSQKCLDIYKSIQKGLGDWVLGIFFFCQVLIVITIYMCISITFFSPYDHLYNIILSLCYMIMFIHFANTMYIVTIAAENVHSSLQELTKPLNITLMKETEEDTKINAKLLIEEIKSIPSLSGNGYFELKKDTLTSITSTTVTYLIILLQFRNS